MEGLSGVRGGLDRVTCIHTYIHTGHEKWIQNFSSKCLKVGDLFEDSYVSLRIILKRIFKTRTTLFFVNIILYCKEKLTPLYRFRWCGECGCRQQGCQHKLQHCACDFEERTAIADCVHLLYRLMSSDHLGSCLL